MASDSDLSDEERMTLAYVAAKLNPELTMPLPRQRQVNPPQGDSEMTDTIDEIEDLTGHEGGVWRVRTQASSYIFDLDQMTVTRHPGPNSQPGINDVTRPIRTIDACRVREEGRWTMRSEGGLLDPIDWYWQISTVIRQIEQIDPDDR